MSEAIRARARAGLEKAAQVAGSGVFQVTLHRAPPTDTSVYPPVENGTTQDYELTAMVTKFGQKDLLNVAIGDVMLLVEAGVVEPNSSDRCTFKGRKLSIMSVEAIQPGGVALMYKLHLKG